MSQPSVYCVCTQRRKVQRLGLGIYLSSLIPKVFRQPLSESGVHQFGKAVYVACPGDLLVSSSLVLGMRQ